MIRPNLLFKPARPACTILKTGRHFSNDSHFKNQRPMPSLRIGWIPFVCIVCIYVGLWQICVKIYTACCELIDRADKKIFLKSQFSGNSIHRLLSPIRAHKYLLRERWHPFRLLTLPYAKSKFTLKIQLKLKLYDTTSEMMDRFFEAVFFIDSMYCIGGWWINLEPMFKTNFRFSIINESIIIYVIELTTGTVSCSARDFTAVGRLLLLG